MWVIKGKRHNISFLPYSLGQRLAAGFADVSWRCDPPMSSTSSSSQMLGVTRDAQLEPESKISCSHLRGNGGVLPESPPLPGALETSPQTSRLHYS